jgi:hypothetical protein
MKERTEKRTERKRDGEEERRRGRGGEKECE